MNKIIWLIVFCIPLISCERILFKDYASSDPYDNFDYLWNQVDKKYSYFELKNIDWDKVRQKYEPEISESMSEEELFDLLANMLKELRDDHVNLISPFNVSRYNLFLQHNVNYNGRTIEEHYIPDFRVTGSFRHDFIENGDYAYIRYSSFMNMISKSSLDHILQRYKNTNGLILDLRSNGGGSIMNIPLILERFIDEDVLAAYSITRNGEGRSDFGPKEHFYLRSHDGITYTKPVAVLIDRGSYSATTMFSLLTKELPNVYLVGDTTGGGGGLPNGGQLPNGWTYRFSTSQVLDLDENNYAEDGVPPDIVAEFDWSDLSKDEIIEEALQFLMNKTN